MRRFIGITILIFTLIVSCSKTSQLEKDINAIDIDTRIERFDKKFMLTTTESLPSLKAEYPFLFPKQFHDSIWIQKINDSLQKELAIEVDRAFEDITSVEDDIGLMFKHLKYYNANFESPRVISVYSDWDYRNKSTVTDSIILISLDTYLGADHKFYSGIQKYLAQSFEVNQIVPDLATQYAQRKIYQPRRKTLLDEMIFHGKIYYFMDVMIPYKSDEDKIGYSKEQLAWARANEVNIWTYFVENQLLFDTEAKLTSRFINPAPFSKFNLELDSESPGRLGRYIGWQIVRSYMNTNKLDLDEMLRLDAETIFNNAKFKPRN